MIRKLALATVIVFLAATVCQEVTAQAQPATATGVTADTIVLGSSLGLTGVTADIIKPQQSAIQAYFNYVNDNGGVHGRKIKWIVYDDQFVPQRAVSNVQRLVESDKVFAVYYIGGTSTTAAAMGYIKDTKTLLLFPLALDESVFQPTIPNVFTIATPYTYQERLLVDYLVNTKHVKRFAMVYANTPGNPQAAAAASDEAKKLGADVVADVSFEGTTTDFSSVVLQLQSKNPEYVLVTSVIAPAAQLIKTAKVMGFNAMWAGPQQMVDPLITKLLGPDANGILGVSITKSVDESDPGVQHYIQILHKYFPDSPPGLFSMLAFATAELTVEALNRAGVSPTQEKVTQVLNNMKNFDTGVTAPVSFSPTNHLGINSAIMLQIQDGRAMIVSK